MREGEKLHRRRGRSCIERGAIDFAPENNSNIPPPPSAASLPYHSVAKHTEKHINLNFIYVRRRRHKNAARA